MKGIYFLFHKAKTKSFSDINWVLNVRLWNEGIIQMYLLYNQYRQAWRELFAELTSNERVIGILHAQDHGFLIQATNVDTLLCVNGFYVKSMFRLPF